MSTTANTPPNPSCCFTDHPTANAAPDSSSTAPVAEPLSTFDILHSALHQTYLAARTRAETAICTTAVKRIECVETTNDDVLTLAKAIAELKKHDAAMLRAEAASRLADARIESLKAAADKKKEPKKSYSREEVIKIIRPAIRDIYGLEPDDDFFYEDSSPSSAAPFSASSAAPFAASRNSARSSPAPHESTAQPFTSPSVNDAAHSEISNFKSEIDPPSLNPIDHAPMDPNAAEPPPLRAPVPEPGRRGDCLSASSPDDIEYQIHSARFARKQMNRIKDESEPTRRHRRHKKKRAPTNRRCPPLLSRLSIPAVVYGAVVKLQTTPTVVPAAFRGSTRQKYVVLFASGNVASDVPG